MCHNASNSKLVNIKILLHLLLPLPFRKANVKRWLWVILYAVIATPAIGISFELSNKYIFNRPNLFQIDNFWLLGSLGLLLLICFHRVCGFRPPQLLQTLKYPGFPSAVLLALLLHSWLAKWTTDLVRENRDMLWCLTATYGLLLIVIFGYSVIRKWCEIVSFSKKPRFTASTVSLHDMDADQLIEWAKTANEINESNQDCFNFAPRAARLYEIISEPKRNCVSVVGPYGSGKSSLINLVINMATIDQAEVLTAGRISLLFCRVSCWGIGNGNSAPESILRQVVEQLNKQIDCLAIQGLPSHYTSGLSKLSGYMESLINMSVLGDPTKQLQLLSPLLQAVNIRLVLIIEDTDRNGSDYDVHQIEGLLTRLREVNEIAFIISAGRDCKVDFSRLVEHSETLPENNKITTTAIIDKIMKKYIDDAEIIVIPGKKTLANDPLDLAELSAIHISQKAGVPLEMAWNQQLPALLNTPRSLKSGLRRFIHAWEYLKGEVDIYELLVASALRERSPRHFTFVQHYWNDLEPGYRLPGQPNVPSTALTEIKDEWEKIDNDEGNRKATHILFENLFHRFNVITQGQYSRQIGGCQSVNDSSRGQIYCDRIFNENITSGPSLDQPMLKMIDGTNHSAANMHILAVAITESDEYLNHFNSFRDFVLESSRLCTLLSEVLSQLRKRGGNKAKLDERRYGGLCKSVRFQHGKTISEYIKWIEAELAKCLPGNFAMAKGIMTSLLPTFSSDSQRIATLNEIRAGFVSKVKSYFAGESIELLINGLDTETPNSLVFTLSCNEPISDWFGPLILKLLKESPNIIIPEIVFLIFNIEFVPGGSNGHEISLVRKNDSLEYFFGNYGIEILRNISQYNGRKESWKLQGEMPSVSELQLHVQAWLTDLNIKKP